MEQIPIALHTKDGQAIPRVNSIRILGLLLDARGCNTKTITHITSKTESMLRLISRVSNRKGGLGEDNLLRIYHAFLMSHIIYVASALDWTKTERNKIDTLMRKSIKRVLGLPVTTSTEKLMQLGMHNTFSEVTEAQKTAQIVRLSTSKAGRRLLDSVNLAPTLINDHEESLSETIRESFAVSPFPRNVHPHYNIGRRKARARAILKTVADSPSLAAFVDAAQIGQTSNFVSAVVDTNGALINAASVRQVSIDVAEQVAIALAMGDPTRPNIYTDSRAAIRAFASGSVSREAAAILRNRVVTGFHSITWFPAHMGPNILRNLPNPNELAHNRARDLTRRGGIEAFGGPDEIKHSDPLLTFHEIVSHYQLERRSFPLPHPKLNRSQSSTFRMLQTGSFPSRGFLSRIAPNIEPHCPDCGVHFCTLAHMLWQCPALRNAPFNKEADWDNALKSGVLSVQLQAVQRACERAEDHGLPAPTWTRPATTTDFPQGVAT